MSIEQNIGLLQTMNRAFNEKDVELYGSHLSPDVVCVASGVETMGSAARMAFIRNMLTAFPEARTEILGAFGAENKVCAEVRFAGTHKGPLALGEQTVQATHSRVEFTYCLVLTFDDGRVTELHEYSDGVEFLGQLGLLTSGG